MKNNLLVLLCFVAFASSLSAQWTKTNGLPGGSFRHFAQVADTTFAQHNAGIQFSTDSGFSWQNLLNYQSHSGKRLSTDGYTLLLGQYSIDPSTRMLRSNDAGQTWIPIPVPDTLTIYEELVVGQWIVIGGPGGAFRTADNGATWEPVLSYLYNMCSDGQRIYGSGGNSILASEDFGQSWDTLTSIEKVSDIIVKDSVIIVTHYHDPNRLTVSTDYGFTWEHFLPNIPSFINMDQMINGVWHEGELYGFWGGSIFKTSDFGKNWTETTAPNLYIIVNGISVGDELLASGRTNGIFRSADGGDSWAAVNNGLISQSPNRLRSLGQNLFAPGREGIYQLAADEKNWALQNVDILLPWSFYSFLDYAELDGNRIVAINGEPWFSTDGGTTWEESTVNNSSFYQMDRIEIAGEKIIGWEPDVNFPPFYVSENNGQNFQIMTSLLEQYSTNILKLDNDNGILYAQSFDNRLFQSTDGSDHWAVVGTTIPVELFANPLGFGDGLLFVQGNSVFVFNNFFDSQYGTKLLFSKDLGQTWQLFDNLTTGFPWGEGIFNDLVESGGYLIAATKSGVSYSSDAGSTWTPWNEGFQNRVASRLCVHDGQLWSSMTSDGVWKRSLADLAPLAVVQLRPARSLEVFPNPSTDHFLVKTDGESGWLTVRETLGKTVFSEKTSGQPWQISCSEWPAGIYHLTFFGEETLRNANVVIQK